MTAGPSLAGRAGGTRAPRPAAPTGRGGPAGLSKATASVSQSSTALPRDRTSSQGLSRARGSQGLSSLRVCRQPREPRAGCRPRPRLEARGATAGTTGQEEAETTEQSGTGVSPPVPGGLSAPPGGARCPPAPPQERPRPRGPSERRQRLRVRTQRQHRQHCPSLQVQRGGLGAARPLSPGQEPLLPGVAQRAGAAQHEGLGQAGSSPPGPWDPQADPTPQPAQSQAHARLGRPSGSWPGHGRTWPRRSQSPARHSAHCPRPRPRPWPPPQCAQPPTRAPQGPAGPPPGSGSPRRAQGAPGQSAVQRVSPFLLLAACGPWPELAASHLSLHPRAHAGPLGTSRASTHRDAWQRTRVRKKVTGDWTRRAPLGLQAAGGGQAPVTREPTVGTAAPRRAETQAMGQPRAPAQPAPSQAPLCHPRTPGTPTWARLGGEASSADLTEGPHGARRLVSCVAAPTAVDGGPDSPCHTSPPRQGLHPSPQARRLRPRHAGLGGAGLPPHGRVPAGV